MNLNPLPSIIFGMLETLSKALVFKRDGRLIPALKSRINSYLTSLKYVVSDPASNNVVLHAPDYTEPSKDKSEIEVVKRIFQSFKKMKEDQQKASDLYLPSSLWQQHIEDCFSYFTDALQHNDLDKFHFFLSNFGSWKQNLGIESNTQIRDKMKTLIGRRYLKNEIFYKNFKNWQWVYNSRKPVSSLTYPTHGNQTGAYIDKTFVGVGSFGNEFYGSILSGLLDDIDRPVVADLGGGYGKLAYFTLRDMSDSCFIDFDLPETLCLAAYYLMKSWPNKKTLLYGEDEYSDKSHSEYELIFMPSYKIENIGQNSVDLFMNRVSLGEMSSKTAINHVHHITNSTRFFFHMNHDVFPNKYSDNSSGLLGYEYPVPKDKFKLLFRYPDFWHMIYKGGLDYYMDVFSYLYERRVDEVEEPLK
ncbi:putative sugar O-methyltransferase [Pseudomonadales bacterium]|nr:putative sugar O-methyltransferase [Pseudomonadales bacterium]